MKIKIASMLAALLCFAASPVFAQYQPPAPASVPAKQTEPDESKLTTHNHYTNKAGQTVHSPAKSTDGKTPQGATAKCGDGTYSFSRNHRGTCSRHGGVSSWL
ncbi:DUF3761 domain-containing protein [Undibacterium terreum]|uniref:DUF3761 domain-containing protein n=1 Tax=Undibacterium terreum TaxID=1224302 RepID=A0A916UXR7_9BURK|nr:DUF3761 domain-containing protein [Undibacterium terreum]GGC93534.1 hypothetical protein GCM10011396_46030 [Undibacterium terreum]